MSFLRALCLVLPVLALAACDDRGESGKPSSDAQPPNAAEAIDANANFETLVDQLTQTYFAVVPESTFLYGVPKNVDPRLHATLNDRSIEGEKLRVARMERHLAEIKAVDPAMLNTDYRRIRQAIIIVLEGALGPTQVVGYGTSFGDYGRGYLPYAINQMSGPTVDLPSFMEAQQSVKNADDAETYLARLAAISGTLDGALEKMRHDAALGAAPPDFIIEKAQAVVDAFSAGLANENILYTSFVSKLGNARVSDADGYASRALNIVNDDVLPAYRQISDFFAEIKLGASHDAGVWRLPNGAAFYRAMIRHNTDSDLDPEVIHQLGLNEVARITKQMDLLLRQEGYTEGSVGDRMTQLSLEERFVYPNNDEGKAEILASIDDQLAGVREILPEWFGHLPKYELQVRAIPEFTQDSAPSGYYQDPAPDGTRPGIYWINLRDTAMWPSFAVPTLTYHEANPGHHMQVSIAHEQEVPLFAKILFSNPSGEGWALYAEALAAEMGLYDGDPFGELGRLQSELHRAVRLVVDTGMHEMRWSREETIDYFVSTEGAEYSFGVSEIERYVVLPAQALGYKLGMLKIQELRSDAELKLGDSFDIREFHDHLLAVGYSALPVIESEIRLWIIETAADQ